MIEFGPAGPNREVTLMDAALAFAKNFVSVKYADLPPDVVEATKRQILDTLGVMLGGSSREGVKELVELITEWGGKPESTILGYGNKVPAPNAAQVNATMGHALDYDDLGDGPTHPSVVIVPACLAAAERKSRCSGQEFITAVALGVDMMCRLGASFRAGLKEMPANGHPGAGWHLTPLYGFLASAGAAARLTGLNEEQTANALGIAYHQCAGNGQCVVDGSLTKRMGPGFAAKGGITAALMAEKGITGAKNCLEGECGLFPVYHQGKYSPQALTDGLGIIFKGINVQAKPYPCCKGTHDFADITLALVNKHNIQAADVREITVFAQGQANLALPAEVKCHPRNLVDSQFSIPWAVATAIARRRVGIGDFTVEAIHSRDIQDVAGKIKVVMEPSAEDAMGPGPVKVTVKTQKGEVYSGRLEVSQGGSRELPPFSTYERKFKDCVSYSIKKLSDSNIRLVIEKVEGLEKLEDIKDIIRLLS
jgi:2-methylcitrate dehydratase PrpD